MLLKPTPSSPQETALTNPSGCHNVSGFASYDEHPGYDYRATTGTLVRAAASGYIVSRSGGQMCILNGIASCSTWGYVGIDHQNGYVTQYGHLSSIFYAAGSYIREGEVLGMSGSTAPSPGVGPHLHFEVLKVIPGRPNNYDMANYAVVDPYGWVGSGTDPLSSNTLYGITPAKLWK